MGAFTLSWLGCSAVDPAAGDGDIAVGSGDTSSADSSGPGQVTTATGAGGSGGDSASAQGGGSSSSTGSGGAGLPSEGQCLPDDCPAFPGAEGEGMYAVGGRGGDVYHVTSLADDGPGSLRDGVDSEGGPRTVVFDVAGIIDLDDTLTIRRDKLTIAGQTAPAGGITIRAFDVQVKADDVVIRHLRFRPGDIDKKTNNNNDGFTEDGLTLAGKRIIVDHVSASWGIDECLSAGTAWDNLTVQHSIIAEGLHETHLFHGEVDPNHHGHSMGGLYKINGDYADISIHHNLFAHNNNRNPAIGSYGSDQTMAADIRNNVIYDCPNTGYTSGDSDWVHVNYVGNYGIDGPQSKDTHLFECNADNNVTVYAADNWRDSNKNQSFDGSSTSGLKSCDTTNTPFDLRPVTTHSAQDALVIVLGQAGARPWARDSVDERIVADVYVNTGGIIDSQDEVGGWGTLATGPAAADSDGDGMPDVWEIDYGSDPDVADHNDDLDQNGYTNLEAYLHWAAQGGPPS